MSTTSSVLDTPPSVPTAAATGLRKWALLPVVLAGAAMVVLDFFIVNVAIPAMRADLRASATAVEWVVAGYGLAFAAGLVLGGRLGDHYGHRRMFALGLALFTLTSAACGVATDEVTLVTARVAQGAASALLMPQVLAVLGVAYTGRDRVRAFTAYAMTLGVAAVAGQLVGGALIELDLAGLGWRSCFLVNVPVGLAALVLTPRLVPASQAQRSGRLDLVGATVVSLALVAVVLPLVEGREHGWPAWTWICLGVAPLLFVNFAVRQRRLAARGESPLVPPALFARRAFAVGLGCVVTFYAAMASYFLVLALYLQDGRGLSALSSGLVFGVLGIGFLVASSAAERITARLGRGTLVLGALLRTAGLLVLWGTVGQLDPGDSVAWLYLPLFVDGIGMGLLTGPLMSRVLADVAPEHAGAASGVLAAAQQVGNSVGVAVIGIIYFGALESGHPVPAAFRAGLLVVAALSLTVAASSRLLPGTQRRAQTERPSQSEG